MDVDLVMANVVLVHEGSVLFGKRLRNQGSEWRVRKWKQICRSVETYRMVLMLRLLMKPKFLLVG
jgi:hypothetical protein